MEIEKMDGRTNLKSKIRSVFAWILGISLLAHVCFLVLGYTVFSQWRFPHEPIHASAEIAGSLVAVWCAWMLVLYERRKTGTNFNIQIAGALIGMGILDGFHAVSHVGNGFVWLHSIATFVGGLLFSTVCLKRWWKPGSRWLVAVGTLTSLVAIISLLFPTRVPAMVADGSFTTTAHVLNVVGGILMMAAAAQMFVSHLMTRNDDDLLFCLHCVLFGLSAVMFEQSSLWDFAWWGWHALRFAAYGAAMFFIIVNNPENELFRLNRNLRLHMNTLEKVVQQRNDELANKVTELEFLEKRFRTTVEAAPVGMVMIDRNGTIMLVNSEMESLFGYSRGEMVGQPIEILVPVKLRQKHVGYRNRFFDDPVARPTNLKMDLFGQNKDGSEFPVELGLCPVEAESEIVALGTVVDLTARKEAEEMLRSSEERLRMVIDGVSDYAIITLDTNGIVTSWNRGAQRIKGYHANEIIGQHFGCFYLQEEIERNWPQQELAVAGRVGRFEDEGWRLRKNGSRFWANVVITAMHDNKGTLVGFSKVTRDLTERKIAEDALIESNSSLQESEAVLRTLMDESVNLKGILKIDGRVVDANHTALNAAGIKMEDVYDQFFWDTPWWQHSHQLQQRLKQAVKTVASGTSDAFEATHNGPDGEPIYVDFSLKPVKDDNGKTIFMIPEGRDITDHKKREVELERLVEEVDRSNQELEQFAYVASHDLQEPLRKIASYCQLLKEECSQQLDDEQREYLDVAINGAKRLRLLVQDLLAFSRVTTRGKPLAPVNANACLQAALENLEMTVNETNAVVTSDSLPTVEADESQLTLLFQNLIANGIKYRSEKIPEIHVGMSDRGNECEIFVLDNGIGIDPQFNERIFQIFQRLHNRRKYSGTGIGLAICKRIVERFGGNIWIESQPGEGSTFFFTLKKMAESETKNVYFNQTRVVSASH